MELTTGGKNLAEVKIQRVILLGDALSPLQFVIAMISLSQIFRKCTDGYKLSKSQEMINHSMYMNDIKLFSKKEKELETMIQTVRIYSQDIGMEFSIDKCDMLVILFTNPSARAGYDTRSIFKRSFTGLNSEFSFS